MVELHEARSDRDQPRDDGADRSPQVLDLEARLIDRARRGDIQAWSRLYQEHFDRVFRHLHHLTGDRDLAEDLVQETFARAMVSIATFRGESRLSTWLGGIAINIVRGHWRRQKTAANANINLRAIHEIAPPSGPAPEEATLRRTRAEVLYAILRELPESLREVFVLRELEGLSAREVADQLGITEGNVNVRASRARARVRAELERLGWLDPKGSK
ncbi:MAG: sigma-70 family RNA polymerase sigma factor [Myxococcales bacterium]|nr:sigma-70 family RNA polymerase sigma factor [Myxococcales bacterium]MCB9702894.1 sigma-70 family RNA polymerase sigma factor [Myxococcales bacterium]